MENIRPPLTLCQLYLLLSGGDSGLLLFISVYNMGGYVCQTRDSKGPLQKEFCSRPRAISPLVCVEICHNRVKRLKLISSMGYGMLYFPHISFSFTISLRVIGRADLV